MPREKVAPPNLPVPSAEYSSRFIEQFSNALRLYFSRLTGGVNEMLDCNTGAFVEGFVVPIGDQTTPIAATGLKMTWRAPYAMTLTAVRASLQTAQTSGDTMRFDVKASGTSLFTTLITIDNGEKTSTTAAAPAVLNAAVVALDDDEELTFYVDRIGDGTAVGPVVNLVGYR